MRNEKCEIGGEYASTYRYCIMGVDSLVHCKKEGKRFLGYYFLSFLITPLVTMIITACLKNISGESGYSNDNVIEATGVSETTEISRSLPDIKSAPKLLPSDQYLDEDCIEGPPVQIPIA